MTFSSDVVAAVLHHMNSDHTDDNVLIVRAFGGDSGAGATAARMTGLDGDRGSWRFTAADGTEHDLEVPWPGGPISERPEIRREVAELYRAACRALGVAERDDH